MRCERVQIALQKDSFWLAIWALSQGDLGSFGNRFVSYRKTILVLSEINLHYFCNCFLSYRVFVCTVFQINLLVIGKQQMPS